MFEEKPKWTIAEAIPFCVKLEAIAPKHGYHVALTGGILYKGPDPRKDLDIVFYSIRQEKGKRGPLLKEIAKELDLKMGTKFNWLQKAKTKDGKVIDFFFPETKKIKNEDVYQP